MVTFVYESKVDIRDYELCWMPLNIFRKFVTILGMSFCNVLLNKIKERFLWVFQL